MRWLFWRRPEPVVPPLVIDKDDVHFYSKALEIIAPTRKSVGAFLHFVYGFSSLLVFLTVGTIVGMAFDRRIPSETLSMEIANPGHRVEAGRNLLVHSIVLRKRICEVDFDWSIKDSAGVRTRSSAPHVNAAGELGLDDAIRPFHVPEDAAPGPAVLVLVASWACPPNFVQAIYPVTKIFPPLHFVITPSEDSNP